MWWMNLVTIVMYADKAIVMSVPSELIQNISLELL